MLSLRLITSFTDPQGNALGSGQVDVNAVGGFDFAFTIPEAVNLGTAQLTLTAGGGLAGIDGNQFYHSFQIQEFRTPEFEVIARQRDHRPLLRWRTCCPRRGGKILRWRPTAEC